MLSTDDFKKVASTFYSNSIARWRVVLQRSLPKNVKLNIPAHQVLPYTRQEFLEWLWSQIQLNAIPCLYCRAPIDVISMQLDHKTPFRRGGGPELSNLQIICARCNRAKGSFTYEEYLVLVAFMDGPGAWFRDRLEGVLIMGHSNLKYPGKGLGKPKKRTLIQDALPLSTF